MGEKKLSKQKFQMPHIFIILYAIILVMAVLSYIIPAGEYTRIADAVTGRGLLILIPIR